MKEYESAENAIADICRVTNPKQIKKINDEHYLHRVKNLFIVDSLWIEKYKDGTIPYFALKGRIIRTISESKYSSDEIKVYYCNFCGAGQRGFILIPKIGLECSVQDRYFNTAKAKLAKKILS